MSLAKCAGNPLLLAVTNLQLSDHDRVPRSLCDRFFTVNYYRFFFTARIHIQTAVECVSTVLYTVQQLYSSSLCCTLLQL